MSVISSTLAPAVAPAASSVSQGSGTAARGADGGTSLSSQQQTSLNSQSAAVVSLTSDSKARGSSSGAGRKVDASFDAQDAKENAKAKGKDKGSSGDGGKTLDVAA